MKGMMILKGRRMVGVRGGRVCWLKERLYVVIYA